MYSGTDLAQDAAPGLSLTARLRPAREDDCSMPVCPLIVSGKRVKPRDTFPTSQGPRPMCRL